VINAVVMWKETIGERKKTRGGKAFEDSKEVGLAGSPTQSVNK
jgi:ABC-type taurine transport system substrate-binding protein